MEIYFRYFLLLLMAMVLTGCYRMPREDEYSMVPCTNNPDITGDRGGGMMPPGMGM